MQCESNIPLTNHFFGTYYGCQNELSCRMTVVFSDLDLCT